MAFNGSGTFLINTAGQPVVSGTVISSTAFNALTADLATGLSTAITKDGQTTVTANIPMSTYKFTGLGVGSAATDSANLSQVQSTVTKLLNSVSGADTITATASPTLAAYAAGQMFYFVAAGDNTTSVTLNIDALGAKAVTRDGSTALVAADIKSGEVIVVVYDGTRFQVVSQLNSAGNATFANVSITSALNVGGVATFTNNPVLSGNTANGVLYLNGSKVATSGSALTFDGTYFTANGLRLAGTDVTNTIYQATGALGISTGSASGITFYTNLANRYQIDATGVAVWSVGGSESMRLTSTGLGIGTASPVARLDVFKTSNDTVSRTNAVGAFGDYASLGAGLLLQQTLSSPYGFALQAANAANSVQFPLLLNPSGGNVGIGTTTNALTNVLTAYRSGSTQSAMAAGNSNTGLNGTLFGVDTAGNGIVNQTQVLPLIFSTSNTERARILSTGEFLAGATSAISVAGVSGFHGLSADANNKWATVVRNTTSSTPFGLAINYSAAAPNNTSSNFVYCYDSGALRASIRANGGLANYQANNVDLSDARTKKDIAPAASMWGKVAALEIVAYKYNDQTHDDVNLGVIAQQVESVEPVWVDADGFGDTPEDGVPLKTVYTKDITFAAIKALQEAMARIETLEAKVTALESK